MKRSLLILAVAGWLSFMTTSLRAEDWTTTDGKVYQNVSVIKVEPDAVTILHQDGGGLIPMTKLPPELQARFHYDPVAAKAAADARIQAAAELAEAEQMAAHALAERYAKESATTTDNSSGSDALSSSATATTYTMDDLIASAHSLKSDSSGPAHYSMDSLVDSVHSLKSTASNHHTMGELFDSGL